MTTQFNGRSYKEIEAATDKIGYRVVDMTPDKSSELIPEDQLGVEPSTYTKPSNLLVSFSDGDVLS